MSIVEVRGLERVTSKLGAMGKKAHEAVGMGTQEMAELILRDVLASRPGAGVPRDTGDLAASGVVEGPDHLNVTRVSFGNAAAPYALAQHEIAAKHDVGESRYLVRGAERAESEGVPVRALQRSSVEVIRAGKSA